MEQRIMMILAADRAERSWDNKHKRTWNECTNGTEVLHTSLKCWRMENQW